MNPEEYMKKMYLLVYLGLLIAGFLIPTTPAYSAPQAELWPRWEQHNPGSTQIVNHSEWDWFLQKYLVTDDPSGIHLVDYSRVNSADKVRLQSYITSLESTPVSRLNRNEQVAFWVNMYNAVTIHLILDNYPLKSIRDIRRPWDTALVRVENEQLTLNDIEHRILRPIWQDPRIHYVVNCASLGCPNLLPLAYTGENWEQLFERAAREFINHPRAVDFSGNRPVFSSIYNWYAVDFGNSVPSLVSHLRQYADGQTARVLSEFSQGGYGRVRYEYDWNLNER